MKGRCFYMDKLNVRELFDIRNEMSKNNYFYKTSFDVIAKHFLKNLLDENPFKINFEDLRNNFIQVSNYKNKEIPKVEEEFYEFICKKYLWLEELPKDNLLELYIKATSDLKEIQSNISNYENLIKEEKKKAKTGDFGEEEDKYVHLLEHYIEKNKKAKEEIVVFIANGIKSTAYNKSMKKIGFSSLGTSLFQNSPYEYCRFPHKFNLNSFSEIKNKFKNVTPKKHRELQNLYEENKENFFEYTKEYIENEDIILKIKKMLQEHHRLYNRKEILNQTLDSYSDNKYLLCNIVPLQIEGIFFDYCMELGINKKEIANISLREKLNKIKKNENIFFYDYDYYAFKFPVIRNKVAHGKIINKKVNHLADLLLLDLYDVCEKITSEELLINKIVDILKVDPKDMKDIIKYSIVKNIDIPKFYELEDNIEKAKQNFYKDEFWNELDKISKKDNNILHKGVYKIVYSFKNEGICKEKCVDILKNYGNMEKFNLDPLEFIKELEYYF